MTTTVIASASLVATGTLLMQAYDLLERANEIHLPSTAQVITKRGLLDEARRLIRSADALLKS